MTITKVSQTVFLPTYVGNIQAWATDMQQQTSDALNNHAITINEIIASPSGGGITIGSTSVTGGSSGQYLYITSGGVVGSQALPTATASVFGIVKPDGTTITISSGVISSTAGGGSLTIGTTPISGGTSGNFLTDSSAKLGQFNLFGSANTWTAYQGFQYGGPYVDGSAWGADPTYTTDSSTAIQNALDWVAGTTGGATGGGTVFLPPGKYKIGTSLVIPTYVYLVGAARGTGAGGFAGYATILVAPTDNIVVTFGGRFSGLRDIGVIGYENTSATTPAMLVTGADLEISNIIVTGGYYAMQVQSIDTRFYNVFATYAYGPALVETDGLANCGCNFYVACKFDSASAAPAAYPNQIAFMNNGGHSTSVMENYFLNCDFSGATPRALYIQDTYSNAFSVFTNCIFSTIIAIGSHYTTKFNSCFFGGGANGVYWNFGDSHPIFLIGCSAQNAGTAGGSGNTVIHAGNYNISFYGSTVATP